MAQSYFNTPNLNTLFTDFIALLFPEICIGCGDALLHNDQMICIKCRIDLPHTHFEGVNGNPVERLFWYKVKIEEATSGYFFSKKSKVQNMIHSFKYKGNDKAAEFMGELLAETLLKSCRFKNIDAIIPVPLHPLKLKKRGFNQAEKIAIGMGRVLQIPVDTHSLIRGHHSDSQTKKALFNRWENVSNIFQTTLSNTLENKHILLVDDVITSGSTIESCANQILQISNTKVSIASLALATG